MTPMSEPGDPKGPGAQDDEHDHDAEVGFVSPASLAGRSRAAWRPASDAAAAPNPFEAKPDLFDPPEPAPIRPDFSSDPEIAASGREPGPFELSQTFSGPMETRFSAERARRERRETSEPAPLRPASSSTMTPVQPSAPTPSTPAPTAAEPRAPFEPPLAFAGPADQARVVQERFDEPGHATTRTRRSERPHAPMSLYAVYVLILMAVPTLGLSGLVALLAVTGRDGPEGEFASSHFIYQQRTLWSAVIAAVLGGLLIVVGVGVLVLFFVAVWVLARGAFGVLRLKSGHALSNPRTWLF